MKRFKCWLRRNLWPVWALWLALEWVVWGVRWLMHRRPSLPRDFYDTEAWRRLRYQALRRSDGKCQCCGRGKRDGAILQVDHIKPKSRFPALAMSLGNLQVLCRDCNLGKSNTDVIRW